MYLTCKFDVEGKQKRSIDVGRLLNQFCDTKKAFSIVLLLVGMHVPSAVAVTYCALRDPVAAIHQLYPGPVTFRTYVGTFNQELDLALAAKLPFEIHADEFGRHSLYVIFENKQPTGFVQARSELGEWGIDEIVWALDLRLQVSGFVFQRTRNSASNELTTEKFQTLLQGLGMDELKELLDRLNSGDTSDLGISQQGLELALSVIRSAMKTISVTQLIWKDVLVSNGITKLAR